MIRTLLRIVLLVILVAAIAAFFIGYRMADRGTRDTEYAVGTTGPATGVGRDRQSGAVDIDTARETGARIGENVAEGTNRAQLLAHDAGLTVKIKSKMALDEAVTARNVDVDTSGGIVTLSGSVASRAERDRAVQLARETEGVTSVNDLLTIEP